MSIQNDPDPSPVQGSYSQPQPIDSGDKPKEAESGGIRKAFSDLKTAFLNKLATDSPIKWIRAKAGGKNDYIGTTSPADQRKRLEKQPGVQFIGGYMTVDENFDPSKLGPKNFAAYVDHLTHLAADSAESLKEPEATSPRANSPRTPGMRNDDRLNQLNTFELYQLDGALKHEKIDSNKVILDDGIQVATQKRQDSEVAGPGGDIGEKALVKTGLGGITNNSPNKRLEMNLRMIQQQLSNAGGLSGMQKAQLRGAITGAAGGPEDSPAIPSFGPNLSPVLGLEEGKEPSLKGLINQYCNSALLTETEKKTLEATQQLTAGLAEPDEMAASIQQIASPGTAAPEPATSEPATPAKDPLDVDDLLKDLENISPPRHVQPDPSVLPKAGDLDELDLDDLMKQINEDAAPDLPPATPEEGPTKLPDFDDI